MQTSFKAKSLPESLSKSVNAKQNNASHGEVAKAIALKKPIKHWLHFLLTILTFGLWGMVWWQLILRSEGKANRFFAGFDDAYWRTLMEQQQPPASLYKMTFSDNKKQSHLDV